MTEETIYDSLSEDLQAILLYAEEADHNFVEACRLLHEDTGRLIPYDRNLEEEFNAFVAAPFC